MADERRDIPDDAPAGKAGRTRWEALAEMLRERGRDDGALYELVAGGAPMPRRELLKLAGASMALAGVAGCTTSSSEKILPYTTVPPEVTPGIPNYYATSLVLDGFATGLLVESHEGRPTKVEGNPEHPASLGATGVVEQASVLDLYDPDRARAYRRGSEPAGWESFLSQFSADRDDGGRGLRFLLEPTSSPLVAALVARIVARFPEAKLTFWSPAAPDGAAEGMRVAFGQRLQPQYDFRKADVILSLDADFLASMPFHVRYARQFAERRRPSSPAANMNRLYAVETTVTPTGAMADHRIRRRPSEIAAFAAAIAAELVLGQATAPPAMPPALGAALGPLRGGGGDPALVAAIARDLKRSAGTAIVIAGDRQPAEVHALAAVMNTALRNTATTWAIAPTLIDAGSATQDLRALFAEMAAGKVDTLVVIEGNPAYSTPVDLPFAAAMRAVRRSVYVGPYENETARVANWFVPAAHYLESWGDARAYDGTVSFLQPLIRPFYGGRTPAEILAVFAGERPPDAHVMLRDHWSRQWEHAEVDRRWEDALRRGLVPDSASPPVATKLAYDGVAEAVRRVAASAPAPTEIGAVEASIRPDPRLYDGRFANNPWLLELPDPTTKLAWDNAALLSPRTAAQLGIENEDVVELSAHGRSVLLPAMTLPGHADFAVTLYMGWGRSGAEQLARAGIDVGPLRTAASPFEARGVRIRKVGRRYPLALSQVEWSEEGRPIALAATIDDYKKNPDFAGELRRPVRSIMPADRYSGVQWAMSIDMSICSGCGACELACQAENNIPVVGKQEVIRGRQMHWLHIDQYSSGNPDEPSYVHQPMLCQHCEKAPCEYVCPVNATVHSPDGLNEMVYNRCVGTRFCSNNCPYKVRRFNWFDWYDRVPANQGLVKLQRNPDVTVRERGVMEKCTYCVQRIRGAEIRARIESRTIREGEVVTACQQACPTRAIQFDSLTSADSPMARWRKEPRTYAVLNDLGTEPRTQYLARIANPNPEIGGRRG